MDTQQESFQSFIEHANARHDQGIDKYKNREDHHSQLTMTQLFNEIEEELADAYNYAYFAWNRVVSMHYRQKEPLRQFFYMRVWQCIHDSDVISDAEYALLDIAGRAYYLWHQSREARKAVERLDKMRQEPCISFGYQGGRPRENPHGGWDMERFMLGGKVL